ncbi:MAG: rhodanese-related sulfurtransferase [Paracoccaceae bacterium]
MFTIAAFYQFARFERAPEMRAPLMTLCREAGIRGTILLAHEGINGTIAGSRRAIDAARRHIRALPGCHDLSWKESHAATQPFNRMKVRVKREIVTMRQPDVDPAAGVGHYVDARDWNALIREPDVALIDTRNSYEFEIGTFEGAVDPGTASFGDFPGWWENNKARFHNKRIAMFCTGGIRCEKSTNYLLAQGVKEVFHLQGGILKYLEDVPAADSTWQGECFVFDGRVSVGHGLKQGRYELCHACRMPILATDKARPEYEAGVACHRCVDATSEAQKAGFRERQKQVVLAQARGERHIGG